MNLLQLLVPFLFAAALPAQIPVPLHQQPCFRHLGYEDGRFPRSEEAAQSCLSLPIFPEMTGEQQGHVIDSIRTWLRTA